MKQNCNKNGVLGVVLALGMIAAPALAQTDPPKTYSTIAITTGETLRLDVANITGENGFPPGPCSVRMGFVNAAGVVIKSTSTIIPAGQAAFLALTFNEAAPSTTAVDSRTRLAIRPVLTTLPPDPCRSVSTAEVFDASLGRTHLYAVAAEEPTATVTNTNGTGQAPPNPPAFGITALTALDTIHLHVTNITGENGIPPGPCVVQMGFVTAGGITVKTANVAIDPGQTASVALTYSQAVGALSTNAARVNVRPAVGLPPGPCRVFASAELLDAFTGLTMVEIMPAAPFPTPWVSPTFAQ